MSKMIAVANAIQPQLAEVQQAATNGNGTSKLILMGGLLVVFVAVFVIVSKKMKK